MTPPPNWLDPSRPYLLGISGGRDSIFLLHWLREHGFEKITCCHLNHGLRGDESDGDEQFLRNLIGEKLICEKRELSRIASESKTSLETAARHARHDFFRQCSRQTGITEILLAHHAEDQAETVLFNLLRGSAAPRGMKPVRSMNGFTILRPMLEIRRVEIDQYLSHRKTPFREDSTNAMAIATRNRLRNEALPLLSEILNRDPVPALLRSAAFSAEQEAFMDYSLAEVRLLDPQGRIHLPTLRDLHPALQSHALHRYLFEAGVPEISSNLIQRAAILISSSAAPSLNLPGGRRLRRKESRLFISE